MIKNSYKYSLILLLIINVITQSIGQDCRGFPGFVKPLGFDPTRSALSSSEKEIRGVCLIELAKQKAEGSKRNKTYQDPTWKTEGFLGAIATDRFGDTYVLKSAKVNMLYNKPKDQNNIYKIDSKTGKMSFFMSLKGNGWTNPQNAFGGMGSFYDCDNDHLIVASIMGSTQKDEIGRIYVVDIAKKTQRVLLDNIDAMGVTISSADGVRKLYYAKARESMIYSVQISKDNQLIGKPIPVISLENLGPRGTDKGRRLRFDANGVLKVYGVDFLYNLSAPSEKKQTVYKFKYVPQKRQWQLIQIQ